VFDNGSSPCSSSPLTTFIVFVCALFVRAHLKYSLVSLDLEMSSGTSINVTSSGSGGSEEKREERPSQAKLRSLTDELRSTL
jgi:hypothetical protein